MPKLCIFLALPTFLFLGCGSYDEVRAFSAEKCGSDYYDPEEKFCINSKTYDKCGGSLYDPSNQKCENNRLLSKCGNECSYSYFYSAIRD